MPSGRYIFGAPGDRRRGERLLAPVYWLANLAFTAALAPSRWTVRPRIVPGPDAWAALRSTGRPLFYYSWHAQSWCTFMVLQALPQELRPTFLAHDGAVSMFNNRSGTWIGCDMLVVVRKSPVSVREQMRRYVETFQRPLMIFPDAGGPYNRLKPGMFEIARELDGLLVPFTVTARPRVTFGRTLRHVLPLPFCRLEMRCGTPLEAATTDLDEAAAVLHRLCEG